MSYFIKVNDVFYFLDSTSAISVDYSATVTSLPTQRKKAVSDHYYTQQPTMSIEGIITDIKSARSNDPTKTSAEYIDGLRRAMLASTPLRVRYRLDKEEEDNWFITNLNPRQDQQNGFGGYKRINEGPQRLAEQVVQSFKISIQLVRVEFAEGATTEVGVPRAYIDALQEKGNRASSTQNFDSSASGKRKEDGIWADYNELGRLARLNEEAGGSFSIAPLDMVSQ